MKETGISGLPSLAVSWSLGLWLPHKSVLPPLPTLVMCSENSDSEMLPIGFAQAFCGKYGCFFDIFWEWSWRGEVWLMISPSHKISVFTNAFLEKPQKKPLTSNHSKILISFTIVQPNNQVSGRHNIIIVCLQPALPAWLRIPLWGHPEFLNTVHMTQESRGHQRIVPSPSLCPTTSLCQFLMLRPHVRVVGVGNVAKQFSFRRCRQCVVHGGCKESDTTELLHFQLQSIPTRQGFQPHPEQMGRDWETPFPLSATPASATNLLFSSVAKSGECSSLLTP